MKVEVKMTGLAATMDTLRQLPGELVSRRGGVVLSSMKKAAKPLDARRRANLQAAIAKTNDAAKRQSTGLLMANLKTSRGKAPSGGHGERLLLGVRRKAYPDRTGKTVTTLASAQLLEWGAPANNQAPEPWIRPAYLSTGREVIERFDTELRAAVDKAVAKLARANKGK